VTELTIACAVGAAAVGGALFTFSDFTMAGLGFPRFRGLGFVAAPVAWKRVAWGTGSMSTTRIAATSGCSRAIAMPQLNPP